MPTKKLNRPARLQVYFGQGRKDLLTILKRDAKKFRVSMSDLIFFSIEYGIGHVEEHFNTMRSKSRATK